MFWCWVRMRARVFCVWVLCLSVCVWYLTQIIIDKSPTYGWHFSLAPIVIWGSLYSSAIFLYTVGNKQSCCCCPGQGRVVLARQGKTLLKSDSSLRVWILNALGCKKFKIVNKPERDLTLEGGDWRDIVPARRFYSIFQFLWNKILIIIRRKFTIILLKLNAIIMIFEII